MYLNNVLGLGIAQQGDFVGLQFNNVTEQGELQQSNRIA